MRGDDKYEAGTALAFVANLVLTGLPFHRERDAVILIIDMTEHA